MSHGQSNVRFARRTVGWSFGSLVGRSVDRSVGMSNVWLIVRLACRTVFYSVDICYNLSGCRWIVGSVFWTVGRLFVYNGGRSFSKSDGRSNVRLVGRYVRQALDNDGFRHAGNVNRFYYFPLGTDGMTVQLTLQDLESTASSMQPQGISLALDWTIKVSSRSIDPLTPEIPCVILLTICHKVLLMFVRRI